MQCWIQHYFEFCNIMLTQLGGPSLIVKANNIMHQIWSCVQLLGFFRLTPPSPLQMHIFHPRGDLSSKDIQMCPKFRTLQMQLLECKCYLMQRYINKNVPVIITQKKGQCKTIRLESGNGGGKSGYQEGHTSWWGFHTGPWGVSIPSKLS